MSSCIDGVKAYVANAVGRGEASGTLVASQQKLRDATRQLVTPSEILGATKLIEMYNAQYPRVSRDLTAQCDASVSSAIRAKKGRLEAFGRMSSIAMWHASQDRDYNADAAPKPYNDMQQLRDTVLTLSHDDDIALPNLRATLGLRLE
jgi:hypothetical protein